MEEIFHLFFDENIINKIADHTNNRINETITRLQRVESYIKSIHNMDERFELMYFRGLWCESTFDRLIIFTRQTLCF